MAERNVTEMMMRGPTLSALALLAAAALAGCAREAPSQLEVRDAWLRLSPVPGRPAAAYFVVAGGTAADRLTAIESAKVANIELHEGGAASGMMTMRKIDGIAIPARGRIAFAPGGNHAMLFGIDPSITPGVTLPLSFRFASGRVIETGAKAIAAGDPAPEHADH